MRTLSFLAPLDFRPHPRCHYQWLLGPTQVPAQLQSLYYMPPLQLLTGNALDRVSNFQGSSAKHGQLGPQHMALQYPVPVSLLFLLPTPRSAPSFSSLRSCRTVRPYLLLCPARALLIISISSHQEGEERSAPGAAWECSHSRHKSCPCLGLRLVLVPACTWPALCMSCSWDPVDRHETGQVWAG